MCGVITETIYRGTKKKKKKRYRSCLSNPEVSVQPLAITIYFMQVTLRMGSPDYELLVIADR